MADGCTTGPASDRGARFPFKYIDFSADSIMYLSRKASLAFNYPTTMDHKVDAVFLESLDPIRLTPSTPPNDKAMRLLHARIEILLALIFGRQISVPEPFTIDSLIFLQIADELLEAREEVMQQSRQSREHLKNSITFMPFRVGLMPVSQGSFRTMFARRIGAGPIPHKPTKPYKIITCLPETNVSHKHRKRIAKAVLEGRDFAALKRYMPDSERDIVDLWARVERYTAPSNSSTSTSTIYTTSEPETALPQVTKWITDENNARWIPDQLLPELQDLRFGIAQISDIIGSPVSSRSETVVIGEELVRSGQISLNHYNLAREFVESAYNRVVASALRTEYATFNTGQLGFTQPLLAAEQICQLAFANTSETRARSQKMELALTPHAGLAQGLLRNTPEATGVGNVDIKWKKLWKEAWMLMADDQWSLLISRLYKSLHSTHAQYVEVEENLNALLTYIAHTLDPVDFQAKERAQVQLRLSITTAGLATVVNYIFGFDSPIESAVNFASSTGLLVLASKLENAITAGTVERMLRRSVRISA